MAYGGRLRRMAGAGAVVALLAGCGTGAAVVELADAAPPDATAVPTPGASAEAAAQPECTPPPLPPKPANWDDHQNGPGFQQIVDQEAVDEALAPVDEFVQRGLKGFAATRIEGPRHGAIWWKGVPPAEIAAMNRVTADCVEIDVVSVRYSEDDLTTAMNRAFDSVRRGVSPKYTMARPNEAYDGIVVGYEVLPEGAEAEALRARLTESAGMPVTLVQQEPAEKT